MANLVSPREFVAYVRGRGYTATPFTNSQAAIEGTADLSIVAYQLSGPRGNKGFVPKDGELIDLDAAALWCDGVDYATRKVAERRDERRARRARRAA